MWKDLVTLRAVTTVPDSDGYPVQTNTDTSVFADVHSVTRSEFYAANASGIKAVFEVEVRPEDWGNQTQILISFDPITGAEYTNLSTSELEPKVFFVVRAYRKGMGNILLTCSDKAV